MVKRIIQSAMLIGIAFLFAPIVPAQPAPAAQYYRIPGEVALNRIVRRTFPRFYYRSYPGGPMLQLYADGFYPIGWSRDGKFAYYFEPVDEACGCYYAELHIVDLKTDKILWEFENKPQERMDEKGSILEDDMKRLWARNNKLFSEKLNEHGIIQLPRFALLARTFTSGGKTYTAKAIAPMGQDDDGLERTRKVTLELSSPSLGKKTLYSADYTRDMYGAPLGVGVAGVFKSPYEDRAAIVMINVQRGYEGPPHTVDLRIAGADLKSGFRK